MKKKILTIITTMTMSAALIAGCGNTKETKNADTTTEVQQPQAAVETATDAAETEKADTVTETTEAEPTETETESSVSADSKLDVKIIGTCPSSDGANVTVFSITNVSDEVICLGPNYYSAMYPEDPVFRPGETNYGILDAEAYSLTEDELHAALDEAWYEPNGNEGVDFVLYTTEFTSDNFGDVVGNLEENREKCGQERLVMCYKNDELVGVLNSLDVEGDSFENLYDADKIVIFWYQEVDL